MPKRKRKDKDGLYRRDDSFYWWASYTDASGKRTRLLEAEHNKGCKRYSVPLNEAARQALLNRANYRAQHCPDSPWVFCCEHGTRIQSVKRSFATACRDNQFPHS